MYMYVHVRVFKLICLAMTEKHVVAMSKCFGGPPNAPVAPWMFALAGRQHSEKLESNIPCMCTHKRHI